MSEKQKPHDSVESNSNPTIIDKKTLKKEPSHTSTAVEKENQDNAVGQKTEDLE
jgi:hypothetical protein